MIVIPCANACCGCMNNRHNAAHYLMRALGSRVSGIKWSLHFGEGLLFWRGAGDSLTLIWPLTTYNNTGSAVKAAVALCNASAEEVVLVHDDLDLALGKWKFVPAAAQGGVAGNNGVRSTIDALGTKSFNRLKIGVGALDDSTHRKRRRAPKGSCTWFSVVWNLMKPFSSTEQHVLTDTVVELAADHLFAMSDQMTR